MDWPLETAEVTFRDRKFVVREMSHGERAAWSAVSDKATILARAILIGLTSEPGLTLEDIDRMPSKLVELLAREIFRLTDPLILEGIDGKGADPKKG